MAASKNLTLLESSPRLSLCRPTPPSLLSRARSSLSTLASPPPPPLLGGSRANLPLVHNAVPFNLSTAALSRHVHHSSSARSSCPIIRRNYSYSLADELEFKVMAWEGIERAEDAARENKLEWVETEHLMKALLEQKDGLARRIFRRAGRDSTSILRATDDFLSKHGKVSGETGDPIMGQYMSSLLEGARKHKKDMEDEFVSVEHFILAFCSDRRFGQRLFRNLGLREKDLRDAIVAVRVGLGVLNNQWGAEKELMNRIRTLKEEIDGIIVEKEAGTLTSLQGELEEAEEHLAEIESKWTGTRLEDALNEVLVGQNEAVTSVADAIRRSRTGLSDPNRPINSFMFVGPCFHIQDFAKTLAGYLFNSEKALVKIYWWQCTLMETVSPLVGPSPLYKPFAETSGPLTELVRRRPHYVLLFEEIEKAHQDVLSIISQILQNGRLTDYQGRTVSFKNTVIIMHSKDYDVVKKQVSDSTPQTFCHEFMNHIDECTMLNQNTANDIAEILMSRLEERLKQRNIELHYTKEVLDLLAKHSWSASANKKIEEFMEHSIARRNFKKDKVLVLNVELNPDLSFRDSFGKPTRKRTHFIFYIGK